MPADSLMDSSDAVIAVHGTMVEVFGQGVLLRGCSGSGKSDLALGLVDRGHRLVADDQVEFVAIDDHLHGRCCSGSAGFIEIRGLGLINLTHLYGAQVVQASAPLGLVLSLKTVDDYDWSSAERLSATRRDWRLLGVSVAELLLPSGRGRDLPLLVETAVRLNRLWQQGYDGAAELEESLATLIKEVSA